MDKFLLSINILPVVGKEKYIWSVLEEGDAEEKEMHFMFLFQTEADI